LPALFYIQLGRRALAGNGNAQRDGAAPVPAENGKLASIITALVIAPFCLRDFEILPQIASSPGSGRAGTRIGSNYSCKTAWPHSRF